MIASALSIGISKRELFEDYYIDEIGAIISAWNDLHNPDSTREERVSANDFLGEGGEML